MVALRTALLLAAALALVAAPFATAGTGAAPLKRWTENKFKVAFALPSDWVYEPKPGKYIFSGPKGTDAYYTTVTIQFINRDAKAPTLAIQMKYVEAEVAKDLNGKVLEKGNLTVAGQPAMRLRAVHNQFHKEWIIVDRPGAPVFYWLLYTAQPHLYPKYYGVFATFVKSVQFTN